MTATEPSADHRSTADIIGRHDANDLAEILAISNTDVDATIRAVTDNADATGSAQTTISVQTSTAKTMFVASKTVSVVRAFSGYQARAVVKIVDGQGRPVSRATVKGVFSGAVSGAARGTTGVTGLCTLRSSRFAANGAVDFDVTSVTKTGWVYGGVLPSDSSASLPPLTGVLSTLWSQS
mgnify:CR=1 FL=1